MRSRNKGALLFILLFLWGCRSIFIYDHLVEGTKFSNPKDQGVLNNLEIKEASGLVASNYNSNLFWTHNDSGDLPRIFLINNSGKGKVEFFLKGIKNRDWEDMGSFLDEAGKSWIYIADIGDNDKKYPSYFIHRFEEPRFEEFLAPNRIISTIESIEFSLPDESRDMETLLIDQRTSDIFVVSKREKYKILYKIPSKTWGTKVEAEKIKTLKFSTSNSSISLIEKLYFLTGGSVSSQNNEIALRNYLEVYYWKKNKFESIPEALSRKPKSVPSKLEPQGEAVAFAVYEKGFYTLSETAQSLNPVHLYFTEKLADNHQLRKAK
ncbi:hypothetical protein EOJ36_05805 [Sandaracinomonas limnophila]|uniref:Uncharacterized protein n=1 Tax=Sandaracinomonas limnophila TaxID=1862386 RepID=A0A437PUL6_9BACT|nr:hypothetical protein [Sandaracinomonas limnophila]RVU25927.1 hypothetical protein EOJ36_05805 [Sandaracinomonas limnophila]